MTDIGFVGLGKLGYPIAAMMAASGHNVIGTDVDSYALNHERKLFKEAGLKSGHTFSMIQEKAKPQMIFTQQMNFLVARSSIIFVAVQTPHQPEFGGTEPLPEKRADFDYRHLIEACQQIREAINAQPSLPRYAGPTIAIISTVLPGTLRRDIMPIFEGSGATVIYNPQFIAMGTVLRDYVEPEFNLIGADVGVDGATASSIIVEEVHRRVQRFYQAALLGRPEVFNLPETHYMTLESAELAKVAYNTMIGMKIAYANTIGEIAHKVDANCDDVINVIKASTDRLISTKYLEPGMGDGGGCHPRDNIAMSWLAEQVSLSHNFFDDVMMQRERHARWLALKWRMVGVDQSLLLNTKLEFVLVGTEFKPETNLEDGSPARLVQALMQADGYDVVCVDNVPPIAQPAAFFIGCAHERYKEIKWPKGSVVIDPFRYIEDQEGVRIISIGRPNA
jgi:UDPglucose 6-dehydrogenase